MLEADEEGEEEEAPSPAGPRPVPPSSSHSSVLLPLSALRRKTRDLPNLCNCHCCGLRFPDKGRSERLQLLDSHWRIVLLCKACLRAVRSAEACSYCFATFAETDEGSSVDCRHCSRRVHLRCLPAQRGYLLPSDLRPDFSCIDCCPFLKKPRKLKDSRPARVSMENAPTSTEFAVAAGATSPAEASAPPHPAAPGTSAMDSRNASVPDGEMALQLHRAMNGSQRITRNSCPTDSDSSNDQEGGHPAIGLSNQEPGICGKAELTAENMLLETVENSNGEPLEAIASSEGNPDTDRAKFLRKKPSFQSKPNAAEMPGTGGGEPGLSDDHLERIGNNGRIDHSPASLPKPELPSTACSRSPQEWRPSLPDRYMKKYCKRSPGKKDK